MPVIILDAKHFKDLMKDKALVVVDFWAEWCGPCRMMGPVFEELSREYESKALFGKVNVDHNPEVSEENDVSSIPCIVFFKSGKEVDRSVGYVSKDVLKAKIEAIIKVKKQ